MEQLIKRYIHDVVRRLPEKERRDVSMELSANITDMLSDYPSEEEIIAVLTKLGPPSKLAERYRQEPRYLISPGSYDLYISVLKQVMVIAGAVLGCVGAFGDIFESIFSSGYIAASDIWGIIPNFIESGISGALQGAFWVTIGFVISERVSASNEKAGKEAWSLKDLPNLPKERPAGMSGAVIPRGGTIAGMVLAIFFTALLTYTFYNTNAREYFAVVIQNGVVISPFSEAAMERSVPFIITIAVMSLAVSSIKLARGRWDWGVFGAVVLQNAATAFIFVRMFRWPDLLNQDFITFLTETFSDDYDIVRFISQGHLGTLMAVVIVVITVGDTIGALVNTLKRSNETSIPMGYMEVEEERYRQDTGNHN